MPYNYSSKNSKKDSNNSPVSEEIFRLIESGEAPKTTIKNYLGELETFLIGDENLDHPDYLEATSQLKQLYDLYGDVDFEEKSSSAEIIAASSFSSRKLRCTEAELDEKVSRIIENENYTADKLQGVLSYIADEVGMHPLELEKYYRAKKEQIEKTGHLQDVKREVDSILRLEKVGLKLEDVIPTRYADLIYDYCEELGLRPEACLTSLLAGFSACHKIGTEIILYRLTGYIQHPAIFSTVVANPGSMKSELRKRFAVKPLLGLQEDMINQFERSEKSRKETEAEYRLMSKDERQNQYPEGLPEFPERAKSIFLEDPTFEALALNFYHYQDQGILYSKDELKGIFDSLNKYRGGKGSDETQLLSLYDGGEISTSRASGKAIFVKNTSLSIFGTIQPRILAKLWGDGEDTNGMFSRFNYCWQPDFRTHLKEKDGEYQECPLDEPLKELFTRAYATKPKKYVLSNRAFTRYRNYYDFLDKKAYEESNPILKHALSKGKGQCGRYILNLHILEALGNRPTKEISDVIEANGVDRGIKITQFFLEQVELLHKTLCSSNSQFGKFRQVLAVSEKQGWIRANDVLANRRALRNTDPNVIREWFLELENLGYGEVKGRGTRLQFRVLAKK